MCVYIVCAIYQVLHSLSIGGMVCVSDLTLTEEHTRIPCAKGIYGNKIIIQKVSKSLQGLKMQRLSVLTGWYHYDEILNIQLIKTMGVQCLN